MTTRRSEARNRLRPYEAPISGLHRWCAVCGVFIDGVKKMKSRNVGRVARRLQIFWHGDRLDDDGPPKKGFIEKIGDDSEGQNRRKAEDTFDRERPPAVRSLPPMPAICLI